MELKIKQYINESNIKKESEIEGQENPDSNTRKKCSSLKLVGFNLTIQAKEKKN